MYRQNPFRFSILPLALCAVVTVAEAQGRSQDRGQGKAAENARGNEGRAEQAGAARNADRARPQPRQPAATNRGREAARQAQQSGNRGQNAAAAARRNDANRDNRDNRDNRASRGASAGAPNPSARAIERASNNARFKRSWTSADIRPDLRRRIASNNWAERVAGGALAHAFARNVGSNAFVIAPSGQMMLVRNRNGDVLVALDEDRARNLGGWKVKPVDDRLGEGSPNFCRSGAGHPNWGRQWCLDKGFGLGVDNRLNGIRWGRNLDASDVVFLREPTSATLTRSVLETVLGQRAVDRLALHAITLGLVDPLVGTWRTDPAGPRVLLVNSGDYPVAEIVHVDRDLRSDRMVVALRPWDL
ncbi:hypothetical protein BH23GEM1_BH23GEM1_07770 [soil metagenome]